MLARLLGQCYKFHPFVFWLYICCIIYLYLSIFKSKKSIYLVYCMSANAPPTDYVSLWGLVRSGHGIMSQNISWQFTCSIFAPIHTLSQLSHGSVLMITYKTMYRKMILITHIQAIIRTYTIQARCFWLLSSSCFDS